MSRKNKQVVIPAEVLDADKAVTVTSEVPTEAPQAATAGTLVLGPKAPKHRVGHNSAAWAVITPMLPASSAALAEAVGKVPNIGGPKGNGMLYVSYAIRRGWLAKQAWAPRRRPKTVGVFTSAVVMEDDPGTQPPFTSTKTPTKLQPWRGQNSSSGLELCSHIQCLHFRIKRGTLAGYGTNC